MALAAWSSTWALAREHTDGFAAVVVGQLLLSGLALVWVVRRRPPGRAALLIVIVLAAAARLVLVPHAPDVSGDMYRYVWDGRVQSEMINPYRHPPAAPALAHLRDADVYPHINRPSVPTIYPPVAQATFLGLNLTGLRSVTAVKLAMALIDVAAIGVMALLLVRLGLQPARVVLYAWHPLAILEVGRSGHVDVIAVLLMMLALLAHAGRRPLLSGALTAGAALAKFYAAAILPALLWVDGRRRWSVLAGFVVTVVAAYLPYLGVGAGVLGYLPGYLEEEGFESGQRFYLLGGLSRLGAGPLGPIDAAQWYQALVVLAMGAVTLWCWWRPPAGVRGADRPLAAPAAGAGGAEHADLPVVSAARAGPDTDGVARPCRRRRDRGLGRRPAVPAVVDPGRGALAAAPDLGPRRAGAGERRAGRPRALETAARLRTSAAADIRVHGGAPLDQAPALGVRVLTEARSGVRPLTASNS